MKSLGFILSALISFWILLPTSQAFEAGACHDDIQKYCKDAKLEGGELKACLKKHLHELSDPCKANLIDLYLEKKKSGSK